MSFKIITPRPELLGKIDRRDLLKLGIAAGGAALMPQPSFAQDGHGETVPSEEFPPSKKTVTPEADLGGLLDQGVMPDNRVLLYYGFPQVDAMGILGEYEPEELLPMLEKQRDEYIPVTPDDRGWRIGFELIGSVAQAEPGSDNMYVADTDGKWLDKYTIFTHENDMELFIDVQMGRKAPHEDYEGLERWMSYPHVHLAIDPEFHLPEDGVPGKALGKIDASDVTRAQNWLVGLSNKYGLPRKMLIIHQFHVYSVENKDQIAPVHGVDLVMNEDGHGTPDMKRETYQVIIKQHPIQYNGFKIFYKEDIRNWENSRLMTPQEVMELDPIPDLLNYQ